MTQVIMQVAVKAIKAVVQAMTEAAGPAKGNSGADVATNMNIRTSGPSSEHQPSNKRFKISINEFVNFEMEVKIFSGPGIMTSVMMRESQ